MLGHLGVNVPDLAVARAYYDGLLPMLDFEPHFATPDEFAYRPAKGKRGTYLFFYPSEQDGTYSRKQTGLQHVAFMAQTRGQVDSVHEYAERHGGEVVHAPREFAEYPWPYYATFWLDPFGLMLEAVCHYDRD